MTMYKCDNCGCLTSEIYDIELKSNDNQLKLACCSKCKKAILELIKDEVDRNDNKR